MSEREGGRFRVWVDDQRNRFRGSLFGMPAIWVVGAVLLAIGLIALDRSTSNFDLPGGLVSTVDSSRSLLGAITSGTIAAASVVFSLTLVAIQLSSSSYSSRVVRTFLRDRFQQNVIGLVTGTFAYSMLVLRGVRGPLEEGGDPFIPRFSILVATLLALASLLALIGSINHTAQNLRVTTITRRLVAEIKQVIADTLPFDPDDASMTMQAPRQTPNRPRDEAANPDVFGPHELTGPGAVLCSPEAGWVQQISLPAIRRAVESGTSVRIEVAAGTYVFEGAPLLSLSPPPSADRADHQRERLLGAFALGAERSLQQDIGFGLVMMEDIAVRALSPGVNDPNTARAVIPQLGELVMDILSRPLTPAHHLYDTCFFYRPSVATYDDYVETAFAQIQHYAAGQAPVIASLISTIHTVGDELIRRRHARAEALDALRAQLSTIESDIGKGDYSDPEVERFGMILGLIDWRQP